MVSIILFLDHSEKTFDAWEVMGSQPGGSKLFIFYVPHDLTVPDKIYTSH
jgi:hypothetical protein